MRLRIIAGSHGGRYIEAPSGRGTRPTAERVREAWFSAIGDAVREARIGDLYAGSGALGIEALSRGADHVHFVETDRRAAAMIRKSLDDLDLADRGTVVERPAISWIEGSAVELDLVLADPPYQAEDARALIERFRARPFAAQFWLEHAAGSGLSEGADWTRRYGDTRLSGFRRPPDPDSVD